MPSFRHRTFVVLTLVSFLTACQPTMQAYAEPFTAQSDLVLLSEEGVLPRNIHLKTFEPHRNAAEFTCRHQAASAPALKPQAQEWHEQALTLTSGDRWANERDWPQAMKLWEQAMAQGHWKATLMWLQVARTGAGVDSERGRFRVEPEPPETVVAGMETLMRQGVADAFFWMGEFHGSGYGVDFSIDREWAFYELAADMGSPLAQTEIALAMPYANRSQEEPKVRKWANEPLEFKLLECAHAQGHGRASYELGGLLDTLAKTDGIVLPGTTSAEQFAHALQILHDGTKFGSEDAASYLFASFDDGDALVRHSIDPFRARRYKTLADALWRNPDLRFPNLDKVLPLPPAQLPQWDGQPESLIDAAKGVRVTPKPVTTSAHQRPPNDRAHVPPGHNVHLREGETARARRTLPGFTSILADTTRPIGLARAPFEGYWQARALPAQPNDAPYTTHLRREFNDLPPMRYRQGERMQLFLSGTNLPHDDMAHGLVAWHFVGQAVPQRVPTDWLAQAGTVRAIAAATRTTCASRQPCPQSGIWQPYALDTSHPMAPVLSTATLNESWKRQAFVQQGERMPSLQAQGLPIEDEQVAWWLMHACERGFDTPIAG